MKYGLEKCIGKLAGKVRLRVWKPIEIIGTG